MTDFVTLVYFRPIKEIYLIVLWKESLGRWSTLNVEVLFHRLRSSPHMLKSKLNKRVQTEHEPCFLSAPSLCTHPDQLPLTHTTLSFLWWTVFPWTLRQRRPFPNELLVCGYFITASGTDFTRNQAEKKWGFLTVGKRKQLSLFYRIVSEFDVWCWGSSVIVICTKY